MPWWNCLEIRHIETPLLVVTNQIDVSQLTGCLICLASPRKLNFEKPQLMRMFQVRSHVLSILSLSSKIWKWSSCGKLYCNDHSSQCLQVACRQLGYLYGGKQYQGSEHSWGQGSGSIWMDEVGCTGNESSLFQCATTQAHNCGHNEDVGIECKCIL